MDERFGYFSTIGIKNVEELFRYLKKKGNIEKLSKDKGELFTEDYLKILLREVKSMLPLPNRLKDFADISEVTVQKLEQIGIKNTKKLYDRIVTPEKRKELEEETGISNSEIMKLTRLTDLSRIKYVGYTFAHMLLGVGIDTAEKAAEADPVELHEKINQINSEKGYYKGHIGLNDMKIFVEAARDIQLEVEY